MTAPQRFAKARELDPAWFDAFYEWHGRPVDRSPSGAALHDKMYAELAERLAAVDAKP